MAWRRTMSFRRSARSPDPRPYNQQSHYRDASPGGVALTTPHAKLVVVSDMVDMLLSDHMIMGHESHLLRYLGAVCASRRKCVSRSRTLLIVRAYAYSRQILFIRSLEVDFVLHLWFCKECFSPHMCFKLVFSNSMVCKQNKIWCFLTTRNSQFLIN